MEYLTTHDIVWINSTVTGEVNRFNYITLEAAMAAQYQYGQSHDVPVQAANFLSRLVTTPPFSKGTRRTAFIALLTFLNGNGYATRVKDTDAAKLILDVANRVRTPQDAVAALAAPAETPLPANITLRKLIAHECNLHVEALKILSETD